MYPFTEVTSSWDVSPKIIVDGLAEIERGSKVETLVSSMLSLREHPSPFEMST